MTSSPDPQDAQDARSVRAAAPVIVWDVDGVLNPHRPGPEHVAHHYRGPAPQHLDRHGDQDGDQDGGGGGGEVSGVVWLHPAHAGWIAELTAAGAEHAWATSWGHLAPGWLADRLGYPDARHWPVIDVPAHGGERFGHSLKWPAVRDWLGQRPAIWIDDLFGGKDLVWADERSMDGVPTLLRPITDPAGLTRADIDTALTWLAGYSLPPAEDQP